MNKFIHAVILAVFCIACFFTWGMLGLTIHIDEHSPLPGFTRLCMGLRPVLIVLPIIAAAYCIYVWIRKSQGGRSWVNFFAATMCVLVLVTLPTCVAAYLPLIASMERLAEKAPMEGLAGK